MGDYVVIGLVGILVILMSILPKSVYNAITYVFSMHKNGIRKIRKYNSTTDSIANLLIGVSIVFCIFYCCGDIGLWLIYILDLFIIQL